jgi:hypothetical protein
MSDRRLPIRLPMATSQALGPLREMVMSSSLSSGLMALERETTVIENLAGVHLGGPAAGHVSLVGGVGVRDGRRKALSFIENLH